MIVLRKLSEENILKEIGGAFALLSVLKCLALLDVGLTL